MSANGGVVIFFQSQGIVNQLVLSVVFATLLYIILLCLEAVYVSWKQTSGTKVVINDLTTSASSSVQYSCNPNNIGQIKSRYLRPSDNERTGVEYTYACFLNINSSAFKQTRDSMHHIFHRGYETPFPLMSPGVFIFDHKNTLRVYQNTSKKWNNYVDIDNIPVGKWFHLVVMARKNGLEVYINGNLASKMNFKNDAIYQNYQDLYLFQQKTVGPWDSKDLASIGTEEKFHVLNGSVDNSAMSRFVYFNYALSYTEIQDLLNQGPNPQRDTTSDVNPPYFLDNWWTGQQYIM
jgi:hypothetical protein